MVDHVTAGLATHFSSAPTFHRCCLFGHLRTVLVDAFRLLRVFVSQYRLCQNRWRAPPLAAWTGLFGTLSDAAPTMTTKLRYIIPPGWAMVTPEPCREVKALVFAKFGGLTDTEGLYVERHVSLPPGRDGSSCWFNFQELSARPNTSAASPVPANRTQPSENVLAQYGKPLHPGHRKEAMNRPWPSSIMSLFPALSR